MGWLAFSGLTASALVGVRISAIARLLKRVARANPAVSRSCAQTGELTARSRFLASSISPL